MSIDITRYVQITSGVGASAGVAQRELIGRLFTNSTRVPVDSVLEFTSAADVGAYFGTTSQEYRRAVFYFGFVSKSLSTPRKLSFGRWVDTAQPALIFGGAPVAALTAFNAITAGTLSLTVGGQTANLTGLNFSASGSLTAVASTLQTAIRAAAGTQFTTATVTYDTPSGRFNFSASPSLTAAAAISVDGSAGSSIADELGWTNAAVYSPASPIQTLTQALDASTGISNNYGSFAFVPAITVTRQIEAATWNNARNVEFLYSARTDATDYVAASAALITMAGAALTLAPLSNEYPDLLPMAILAATDYTRRGSVQNYMYQTADLSPAVLTNALADTYDAARVNYYGRTQTAGQQIDFYQRGVMTGGPTAPTDLNTYANEIWFKDAAQAELMALLLALPRIPANDEGRAQVLAILQGPIDRALLNGTISVGKTLTRQQRLFVSELTGSDDAWPQVQNIGYWVDAVVTPYVNAQSGLTEYKVLYTLVYAKDDTIRKVEGSHILV